jgi:hypothetical protein
MPENRLFRWHLSTLRIISLVGGYMFYNRIFNQLTDVKHFCKLFNICFLILGLKLNKSLIYSKIMRFCSVLRLASGNFLC